MRKPKIKTKSEFQPKRLIFFAGMPRLNEGELVPVKAKKEKEGSDLDINGLVSQSNSIIDGHAAQLEELPAEYNQRLHDEIVDYFLASPGRFEQDAKKGLSTAEFNAYRVDMVSKVRTIMRENAPTEEDIRAVKEAREGAESAEKASKNVKPLEVKEVTEDPGHINNLPGLNQKFSVYNGWNASLQQEAANVMQTSQSFQKEYARYATARKGVRAHKQFMAYLYPEKDQERIEMQRKLNESKAKVAAAIKKYEATKDKISKYGKELGKVSNRLKQKKMAERDERMRRFASMSDQTEDEREQKRSQYQLLEARQREMQTARNNLNTYRENISENRESFTSRAEVAKNKQEQLTEFSGALDSAITKVERALQNRNLSDRARSDLEQTREQLLSKRNEASTGLNAANTIVKGNAETVVQLEGAEKEAAEKSLNLGTHLSQQVEPAIAGLDASIANLETEKLEFATTKEQIKSYYEQAFNNYDAIDEEVDSAVLRNNLANDRVLASLKSQQAALNNVNLAPPSGVTGAFEATIGVPLSMAGGAINMAGEGLLDQATWLSDTLERARPEMNTGVYVLARARTEIVGATIGVAGGLFEMAGGIVTLAAHPIDTAKGLGSLVGLNPNVSAGEAWEGMGKALISYEDFKKGRIGVGIGKLFANVATTVTGAGALGAGGKAGATAYTAARAAGAGVTRSMAKAGVAGTKGAAIYTGAAVKSGAKGAVALPGNIARKTTDAARKAAARTKGKKAVSHLDDAGEATGAATPKAKKSPTADEATGAATPKADDIGEAHTIAAKNEQVPLERADTVKHDPSPGEKIPNPNKPPETAKVTSATASTDEMAKSIDSYNSYKTIEAKVKAENPGITDDALKTIIEDENPGLLEAAKQFEDSFNSLNKTTPEMAESINSVNQKIRTTEGLLEAVENAKDGHAPLTSAMVDEMLTTKHGLDKLEEIIQNSSGKVQIESGIRSVNLAKKIEEARAFHKMVENDFGTYMAMRKTTRREDLISNIEKSLTRVVQGKEIPADDDLAQVLSRLSKRDPEAFSIIKNSQLEDIMSNRLIESLLDGRSIKVEAPDGSIRRLYLGEEAGRGGMGVATYVVYEQNGKAIKAAYKTPHQDPTSLRVFEDERIGASMVTDWDHPSIIKQLEVGDSYILYETGNNSKNLRHAMNEMKVDEWMQIYRESVAGTLEYWNRGYFHADIKPGNIITYTVNEGGRATRTTKILDNNPIPFSSATRVDWPRTLDYCFERYEIADAVREVMRKTASLDGMNVWMGRAQDVKAHGAMLEAFIKRKIDPVMTNNPATKRRYRQFQDLLEGTKDPAVAGEAGYLERMTVSLEELTKELGLNQPGPLDSAVQRNTSASTRSANIKKPTGPGVTSKKTVTNKRKTRKAKPTESKETV